jgi:hypothetical protein
LDIPPSPLPVFFESNASEYYESKEVMTVSAILK